MKEGVSATNCNELYTEIKNRINRYIYEEQGGWQTKASKFLSDQLNQQENTQSADELIATTKAFCDSLTSAYKSLPGTAAIGYFTGHTGSSLAKDLRQICDKYEQNQPVLENNDTATSPLEQDAGQHHPDETRPNSSNITEQPSNTITNVVQSETEKPAVTSIRPTNISTETASQKSQPESPPCEATQKHKIIANSPASSEQPQPVHHASTTITTLTQQLSCTNIAATTTNTEPEQSVPPPPPNTPRRKVPTIAIAKERASTAPDRVYYTNNDLSFFDKLKLEISGGAEGQQRLINALKEEITELKTIIEALRSLVAENKKTFNEHENNLKNIIRTQTTNIAQKEKTIKELQQRQQILQGQLSRQLEEVTSITDKYNLLAQTNEALTAELTKQNTLLNRYTLTREENNATRACAPPTSVVSVTSTNSFDMPRRKP